MRISSILDVGTVRVLLFIRDKGEARYSELLKVVTSRGTLATCLKDLEGERLIERRIVASKPIQAYYSLTDRGKHVATRFSEIRRLMQERA